MDSPAMIYWAIMIAAIKDKLLRNGLYPRRINDDDRYTPMLEKAIPDAPIVGLSDIPIMVTNGNNGTSENNRACLSFLSILSQKESIASAFTNRWEREA